MKNHQLFCLWALALFCFWTPSLKSQLCNPTENWVNTQFPGHGGQDFTEMNGNLYTVDFHVPDQEYKLWKYDGNVWQLMSAIPVGGVNYGLANYQNQIFLVGTFTENSNQIPGGNGIVRWDSVSNTWSDVGGGLDGYALAVTVYNNALYVGGNFDFAGNIPVKSIAKWDGVAWDSLSLQSQLDTIGPLDFSVYFQALGVWDNKLLLGGDFQANGHGHFATWDGTNWGGLGDSPDRSIDEFGIYNGDLVIYGVYMDFIGTSPFKQLARWDGTNWQAMGMMPGDFVDMRALVEYNGDLWVVGPGVPNSYYIGGGQQFDGAARWDGSNWHLVTGFDGYGNDLAVFEDRLHMAGVMEFSCGVPLDGVSRLCTFQECQPISGQVYQDDNLNCIADPGEFPMNEQWIEVQPGGTMIPTDNMGQFSFLLDTGTYTVDLASLPAYYTTSCPAGGYTAILNTAGGASDLDFGLEPIPNTRDLILHGGSTPFRPGFTARIYLNYENIGTQLESGTVELDYDPAVNFNNNSSIPLSSQNGNTLIWNYANLAPTQSDIIWAEFDVPVNAQLGDSLYFLCRINPFSGDVDTTTNKDSLLIVITGSFDPNDKQVHPAGSGPNGDIPFDTPSLTYTIRFQNTGTDTAFTVILRDEIDPHLDLGSLTMLAASHNYILVVEEDRKLRWTFENILLPDSNANEAASHGFIRYEIDLLSGLALGTQIENTAAIYFDFNEPIITNTTLNTLVDEAVSIDPLTRQNGFSLWPLPAKNHLMIDCDQMLQDAEFQLIDLHGRIIMKEFDLSGKEFEIPLKQIRPGLYLIQILEAGEIMYCSKVLIE